MATDTVIGGDSVHTGTWQVKTGLAKMLKGGVIMDVVNAEQAKIAEDAGAVSVMALERVPSDIRKDGGVARMADPSKIVEIMKAKSIYATHPRSLTIVKGIFRYILVHKSTF